MSPQPFPAPRKVLVLRYSSLGDVALTNPTLDLIARAWPDARVYFATKPAFAPAIEHHPALTAVIALRIRGLWGLWAHARRLRKLKPDLVLDLHDSLRSRFVGFFLGKSRVLVYDKDAVNRRLLVHKLKGKPGLHTVQKYLKPLEEVGVPIPRRVPFTVSVDRRGRSYLRDFLERRRIASSQQVVGLGPGSLWATKRWLPERYAELASRLVKDYGCKIFWFGSATEAPLIRQIQSQMSGSGLDRGLNLAEDQTLEQSLALLGRCDVFIGNDSGLTHLASGRGAKVVVLFGSTTPALGFAPWGPHTVVERAELSCRPCAPHGRSSCPLGHFKCMKELTVDQVEIAAKRFLRRNR
ncbi:MAG: glycosyltransferase family 9 protein [bacterium]